MKKVTPIESSVKYLCVEQHISFDDFYWIFSLHSGATEFARHS